MLGPDCKPCMHLLYDLINNEVQNYKSCKTEAAIVTKMVGMHYNCMLDIYNLIVVKTYNYITKLLEALPYIGVS